MRTHEDSYRLTLTARLALHREKRKTEKKIEVRKWDRRLSQRLDLIEALLDEP